MGFALVAVLAVVGAVVVNLHTLGPAQPTGPAGPGAAAPSSVPPTAPYTPSRPRAVTVAGTLPSPPGRDGAVPDDPSGAPWREAGLARLAVGKLVEIVPGRPDTGRGCTATSVASSSGLVVVTAAHCIKGVSFLQDGFEAAPPPGTRWEFAPGYDGGNGPAGRWPVERLVPDPAYNPEEGATTNTLLHDVAFVRVAPRGGQTLAQVVGALGLEFNMAPTSGGLILGYPADDHPAGADGSTLRACSTTGPALGEPGHYGSGYSRDYDPGYSTAISMLPFTGQTRCAMGRGSSGGPWLAHFDPASGAGAVTGVSSVLANQSINEQRNGPDTLDASALSTDFSLDLYHQADR